MKNKKRLLFMVIAIIVFILALTIRYVYLNSYWPNPSIYSITMGNIVEVDQVEYSVQEVKIGSTEDILRLFNPSLSESDIESVSKELQPLPEDRQGHALLAVKLTITNNSDKELLTSNCFFLPICQGTWSNGASAYVFPYINDSFKSSLAPGETNTYIVPYNLYEEMFSPDGWGKISSEDFYLLLQYYPQKIELSFTAESIK